MTWRGQGEEDRGEFHRSKGSLLLNCRLRICDLSFGRRALGVGLTIGVLTACGSQAATTGAMPMGVTAQSRAHRAPGSGSGFLYAAVTSGVDILTYPDGKKLAEIDKYGPICTDPNTAAVYISNGTDVDEYPPGSTTLIAYVDFPQSEHEYSWGCSVDPTTGDLAVMMKQQVDGVLQYYVNVYSSLNSPPTQYSDPDITQSEYCGYDAQGNLFIDGESSASGAFKLDELPKGSSSFITISLNFTVGADSPLQWDGTYITLETPRVPSVYRIAVSGSTGTLVGKVRLDRDRRAETWIQGHTVVAGHWMRGQTKLKNYDVGFWLYPAGDRAYKIIRLLPSGGNDVVSFVAVAVAPSGSRSRK